MNDAHDQANAHYEADVQILIGALRSDLPPSDAVKEAAARVGAKLLFDLGSIAMSLKRIADAQEKQAFIASESIDLARHRAR